MSPSPSRASTALLAVDTGGTFTDLVLLEDGRIRTLKVPSTPADPAQAVLDGIKEILDGSTAFTLLHGSTVATNALLERRGARVILITNRGFEDVIEIGRQNRPQLYALVGHRLPPLVDRADRLGITGRLGPHGEVIQELDADELTALARSAKEAGAEAIAICLLHAYADPSHEITVADAFSDLGIPLSVSSALLPEFREYERTSTTVVNAYVSPIMSRYLGRLADEAGAERVSIMGSNGGAIPVERARREPVHTVLSGPAGGVVGALTWARRAGHDHVLSFDMGGTSTDVSLCPGHPLRTREFVIAEQPTAIPVLDIHTVGAGGGSLARVDAGGALRVGPQSAGAQPGPICYGRGGLGVTVTDAHVWLGRLPPDAFPGGGSALDRGAIQAPLAGIAAALGTSLEDAAAGIVAVADTAMERALRVISVERGYDPADFVVVAFGGAGGLHVAELTSRLGAGKALVPPDPGLLSAYGMLSSPVTRETARTVLTRSDDGGAASRMETIFADLERQALDEMQSEGVPAGDLTATRWVDARYFGQSFELRVPADDWASRFHAAHAERYGYSRTEAVLEAVTLRAIVTTPPPRIPALRLPAAEGDPPAKSIRVHHDGSLLDAALIRRKELRSGHEFAGPAVIQEYSGTTWVPPEYMARVDEWGCIHLTR